MRVLQFPPAKAAVVDLVEFFDTHDMGDLWAQMPEVDIEIDLQRRRAAAQFDADSRHP